MESKFCNARNDTQFPLVNRKVSNQLIKLSDHFSLGWSMFDETLPTKVVIHGFMSSDKSQINSVVPAAYIRNHDVNVIKGERSLTLHFLITLSHEVLCFRRYFKSFFVVVGWNEGSKTCYIWAKKRVTEVGTVVAEFLDFLMEEDPIIYYVEKFIHCWSFLRCTCCGFCRQEC